MHKASSHPKLTLILIGIASLGLIVLIDNIAFKFLNYWAPSISFIAQIRLPSLSICFLLYRFSKTTDPFLPAPANWKKSFRIAILWLVPTFYFVLVKKVWVPEISGWIDITAFMLTGLLAEEFLFRGCIYNLAMKTMPNIHIWRFSAATIISALLFGLQHIGYHRFQFTQAATIQIAYTFVMGIFFASLRESSGRLWPVVFLHFIVNSLTLLRNI